MSFPSKTARRVVLVSAAASLPALSTGQEDGPRPATILITGPAALDVSRAVRDAVSRLREPACQRVLDDFTDTEGRPLREGLGASTPDGYLERLVIRDGEIALGSGHCASRGAAAFTANGAAVFVCGKSFRTLTGGARANALIHEMLHTLAREAPGTGSAQAHSETAEAFSDHERQGVRPRPDPAGRHRGPGVQEGGPRLSRARRGPPLADAADVVRAPGGGGCGLRCPLAAGPRVPRMQARRSSSTWWPRGPLCSPAETAREQPHEGTTVARAGRPPPEGVRRRARRRGSGPRPVPVWPRSAS
jgi:hypothetical protein